MDVNLPSQSTNHQEHEREQQIVHKKQIVSSMHAVYGGAIIIMALVLSGVVCVLGNIQIPYLSSLYTPVVPPPYVSPIGQRMMAHPVPPVATTTAQNASSSTVATSTMATTSKKKL